MPTLQEVHERVVKLHGPQSPVALAIAQQLEAEKANKGRSAASLFVEGGYGHMLHEKNPPRKVKTAPAPTARTDVTNEACISSRSLRPVKEGTTNDTADRLPHHLRVEA